MWLQQDKEQKQRITMQGTTTQQDKERQYEEQRGHVKREPEKVRWCGSGHSHQFPNCLVEPVVGSVSVHLTITSSGR